MATFVGTPRMNVLPVQRHGDVLSAGPFELPGAMTNRGRPWTRASGPSICTSRRAQALHALVELVEGVGDVIFARLVVGAHRLVARLPSAAGVRAGEQLRVDAATSALVPLRRGQRPHGASSRMKSRLGPGSTWSSRGCCSPRSTSSVCCFSCSARQC